MNEESYAEMRQEEYNADMERQYEKRYDHDDNVATTYERAQYNEEVEQDIYERDDKMGAI